MGSWGTILISPVYMTLGHLAGAVVQAVMCGSRPTSSFFIPHWVCMMGIPLLISAPTSVAGHLAWCVTTGSSPCESLSGQRSRNLPPRHE